MFLHLVVHSQNLLFHLNIDPTKILQQLEPIFHLQPELNTVWGSHHGGQGHQIVLYLSKVYFQT